MAQSKRDKLLDQYEREIRTAMARTLWVMAYTDWYNELTDEEKEQRRLPRPTPGGASEDWAPASPQGAHQAARDLAELFGKAEGVGRRRPLTTLYEYAMHADTGEAPEFHEHLGGPDMVWDLAGSNRALPLEFGSDLAMMALESGVSWFDDHKEFDLEVPRFSVTYDGTDFMWEGTTERFTAGSKRVGMAFAEYSFARVMFQPDGWGHVLAALKIKDDPKVVVVPTVLDKRGTPDLFEHLVFMWTGKDIELVTRNDPTTGYSVNDVTPSRRPPRNQQNTRIDYAGTIGIRGERAKVVWATDLVAQFARGIVTGRPSDYYQRFPVEAATLRKNATAPACTLEYHDELKADPARWAALEDLGTQKLKKGGVLELRNCDRCHTTLSVKRMGPPPGVPMQNPLPGRLRHAEQARKRAEAGLAERQASADFQDRKCDDACPGWDVFATRHGLGIQVCDECNNVAKKLGLPVLEDADIKHLPAAAAALRRSVSLGNTCADCGGSTAPGTPDPHVCGETEEET